MDQISNPKNYIGISQFENFVFERIYSHKGHEEFLPELQLFGQFVGSWDMEVIFYDEQGKEVYHQLNEWTFFWILDGRAIQDILIGPNPNYNLSIEKGKRRIGTSVRMYNNESNIWEMTWFGPTSNTFLSFKGGKVGQDIVLTGMDEDGSKLKWIFSNIEQDFFVWNGFNSNDNGETWKLDQKMFGQRKKFN